MGGGQEVRFGLRPTDHMQLTTLHSLPPTRAPCSAYLVFDTQLLIQRFDLDDYIWAAVTIYLGATGRLGMDADVRASYHKHDANLFFLTSPTPSDVINLFLYILRMVGESQRSN